MVRPRVSLLTALLLTTIVAMGIVIAMLWQEVKPLRIDNRRLRSEVGELSIDDPNRPYAIQVQTHEDDTWKWRIYLPPGGSYSINSYSGTLPPRAGHTGNSWFDKVRNSGSGMCSENSSFEGEVLLEGRLVKEADEWYFVTRYTRRQGTDVVTSGGGKDSIYQPSGDWLSDRRSQLSSSDVGFEQKSYEPGSSILLVHVTRPETTELPNGGHSSRMPQGPAEGIAVWIEQPPVAPAPKVP